MILSLKGCNAPPSHFRNCTQRPLTPLNRRGIRVFSCCSRSGSRATGVSKSIQMKDLGQKSEKLTEGSVNLAEELQFGTLTEDKLSYKRKFVVRWYEVGFNNTAAVVAITSLLQETGCNHLQHIGYSKDGFGTGITMRQLHLIWVTTQMHIEIYEYPSCGDVVEIETWLELGRTMGKRDWMIRDASGTVIGKATSKWVMMNQDTRRLTKISEDVLDDLPNYCSRTPRLAFPKEDNSSMKKIPKLEEPSQYSSLGLKPRRADLDMNQHVNNVTYIGWILESMPQEIINTHELQKVTLVYKQECQYHNTVDSITSVEGSEAVEEASRTNGFLSTGRKHEEDCCRFLHCLRMSSGGPEINRGRTEWRRKPKN